MQNSTIVIDGIVKQVLPIDDDIILAGLFKFRMNVSAVLYFNCKTVS